MNSEKAVKSILSLEKALNIVEIMAAEAKPMRLKDISMAADIPASTALRLVHTLELCGYIRQDPTSARYYLSLKWLNIGNQVVSSFSFADVARPYLKELAAETGHSVNLAARQSHEAIIVDVVEGYTENEIIITRPGRIIPLYCSAIGRAMLMNFSGEQLEDYLNRVKFVPYTPITISAADQLIAELDASRKRGYCYDPGELRHGISGIGAPIISGTGETVASISVAELSSLMTPEIMDCLGRAVMNTAKRISALI